ncbi:RNA-directed DNA polymerase, eukaryota [Tanacetum coccineum]
MGMYRSKTDELAKLSSSIFVTNFPDKFSAKELWTVCKQYGTVVDAFIPDRRSKAGKRFGFVRFIKIFDVDREWAPNGKKLIIISVYAPQELREKKMLWDYLILVLKSWNDDVIIMGDFNEVCTQDERHGSIFNAHVLVAFNCLFHTLDWRSSSRRLQNHMDFVKLDTMELAQKAKIKWVIEGDENSKYYHGVLNKKQNQLAIRGILVEGIWIESPILVKDEFLSYFASRFNKPPDYRLHIDLDFLNKLSLEQQMVLEIEVTREEIKKAVWDFGVDKLLGPDGLHFDFIVNMDFSGNDVVEAVVYTFFNHGLFYTVLLRNFSSHRAKQVTSLAVLVSIDMEQFTYLDAKSGGRSYLLEVQIFRGWGLVLMGFIHKKIATGRHSFGGTNGGAQHFPICLSRMYALETQNNISVALKLSHDDLLCSFRRAPRAGAKELQYIQLVKIMEGITLIEIMIFYYS